MARVGIILETPALVAVGMPIITSADFDIEREINAAGAWSLRFPATEALARQVKSRWRVSIAEEGRVGYLLRRGIVMDRNFTIAVDGSGVLQLRGYTRLYGLMSESTHIGLDFDGTQNIQEIAETLAGESVAVPASASSRKPVVTYNDTSKLAALLGALELVRYNIRETFDGDRFELVEQDNVPDSGFRFVSVEQAGPELEAAHEGGLGIIAGTPTVGYSGKDLGNRIIPVGTEWDGNPLTLASSNKTAPYAIQTGVNPDGSNYHYLEDGDSVAANGLIETQFVRADVKNPSDDAGTRLAAANVLYALAAGRLLQIKSDIVAFAAQIANGHHIDTLPGNRVRVQFRGLVRSFSGRTTWLDLDRDFLIVKRRDAGSASGVRGVSFTLTAPEVPFFIPALPTAVPIPPPPSDPPDPPAPRDPRDPNEPFDPNTPEDPWLPQDPGLPIDDLIDPSPVLTNYQPCCEPPNPVKDGAEDPPDINGDPASEGAMYFETLIPTGDRLATSANFPDDGVIIAIGAFVGISGTLAWTERASLAVWPGATRPGTNHTYPLNTDVNVPAVPCKVWTAPISAGPHTLNETWTPLLWTPDPAAYFGGMDGGFFFYAHNADQSTPVIANDSDVGAAYGGGSLSVTITKSNAANGMVWQRVSQVQPPNNGSPTGPANANLTGGTVNLTWTEPSSSPTGDNEWTAGSQVGILAVEVQAANQA